jgi:hypothetical protein
VTFSVPAEVVLAVAHFWPSSIGSTKTVRVTVPTVLSFSNANVPGHEGTERPERGGNDGDVRLVVPAVDGDELRPPAAYPRSARNKMNRMKPNAESVESSAMLCLDRLDQ